MELIIVWLFLGIITSVIGHSKGRNWLVWFIWGALLSVFGLILVCAMPAVNVRKY